MTDDPLAMPRRRAPSSPVGMSAAEILDRTVTAQADLRAAQLRVVDAQFEVVRERFDGIDRATQLFQDALVRLPTDVDKQVGNLRLVHEERFRSIDASLGAACQQVALQFEERDKRGERESRDNKVAVDAAFAAQKEAAWEQNKSNTLAITKSELATAEKINKLEQLVTANLTGLNDKVEDLKVATYQVRQEMLQSANAIRAEVITLQSGRTAVHERTTDVRQGLQAVLGVLGTLVAVAILALTVYAAIKP